MEKKNTGMKITIVILCLLVVGLTGYIVYDKVLSKDNIESNQDSNVMDMDTYSFSDFNGAVFQGKIDKTKFGYDYLKLYKNGTYSYRRDSDFYIGNYTIEENIMKLNIIFENDIVVSEEKTIQLEINASFELVDTSMNARLQRVNHPVNPGGFSDWYSLINDIIK